MRQRILDEALGGSEADAQWDFCIHSFWYSCEPRPFILIFLRSKTIHFHIPANQDRVLIVLRVKTIHFHIPASQDRVFTVLDPILVSKRSPSATVMDSSSVVFTTPTKSTWNGRLWKRNDASKWWTFGRYARDVAPRKPVVDECQGSLWIKTNPFLPRNPLRLITRDGGMCFWQSRRGCCRRAKTWKVCTIPGIPMLLLMTRWGLFIMFLVLTALMRYGCPDHCRGRVWRSCVEWRVFSLKQVRGVGYYQSLVAESSKPMASPAAKQVCPSDRLIDWSIDISTDYPMINSSILYIDWLIDWLVECLIVWLIGWLIDWLIDWLVKCLIDWVIDWLIDWGSPLHFFHVIPS